MEKSGKPIPSYLNDFLDWLDIEKGLSTKSQENYARFLKRFLDWLKKSKSDNLKPHELTPQHIWQYRTFLARHSRPNTKESLKKSTQNYYLIALRALLTYFADHDIVALPSDKIKLSRDKEERQIRFLTLEQLEKLFSIPNISTIQGLRDKAILWTFFSTGMRIAELTSLNRKQISIRQDTKDLELTIVGKGGRVRTVYFSEPALRGLAEYLKTREDEEEALFINYRAKGGAPRRLSPRYIEKMIKKYALHAGLPVTTTPHVMRHTFATDLLAQGIDLKTIQEFLGHRNIAATQIYAHVTNRQLREIHRRLHNKNRFEVE